MGVLEGLVPWQERLGVPVLWGPESASQRSMGDIIHLSALSPYTARVALWTEAAGLPSMGGGLRGAVPRPRTPREDWAGHEASGQAEEAAG